MRKRAAQAGIAALKEGYRSSQSHLFQNCLRDCSSQNLSAVHGWSSAMLGLDIPERTDAARRAAMIVFMIISLVRVSHTDGP
jgi:hypothetical protein